MEREDDENVDMKYESYSIERQGERENTAFRQNKRE